MTEVAVDCEQAGFAGLWTLEAGTEPFLPLALAAEHTTRLRLGTGGRGRAGAQPDGHASTPAYRDVFARYDLGDLADRLRMMSRAGQWDEMGELIDDDVLAEFSVEAPPQAVPTEIRRRYDGLLDRALIYQPYPTPPGLWRTVGAISHQPPP